MFEHVAEDDDVEGLPVQRLPQVDAVEVGHHDPVGERPGPLGRLRVVLDAGHGVPEGPQRLREVSGRASDVQHGSVRPDHLDHVPVRRPGAPEIDLDVVFRR